MTLPALDRLPPFDSEAEDAVIAALLVDPEAIFAVSPLVEPADFFREKNGWIFEACLELWKRDEAINQITVAHELDRKGQLEAVGGQTFLADIVRVLPTATGVEFYAGIVKRDARYRALIAVSNSIMEMAFEAPAEQDQVFTRAEDLIQRIRTGESFRDFVHVSSVLQAFLEEDADAAERAQLAAIQTGFSDLDALLGGLKRSDLVIVGARPSVGKSSFALGIARNAALKQGASVAFYSLEMSSEQLAQRLLSSEAGVDSTRLRLGQHTEPEERRIIAAAGELSGANIWFDDSPVLTVAELRAKSRRLANSQGLDLVVIDYLQLMQSETGTGARDNRVQEISYISRSLKALARELDAPVVALAQLSRAIEQRHPKTPLLSDLRDSGSIEQDADVVLFLSREEMHTTPEQWAEQHPELPESAYPRGVAQVAVAKHRNGPTGNIELRFRQKTARFEDWQLRTNDLDDAPPADL